MDDVIIGVDLGGTRVRAARLDRHLKILERHETLTLDEEGKDATIQRIKDLIKLVLPEDETPVAGIGVSSPGPLNPETGVIIAPPNLQGWHDVPLGDILQAEFGVPVFVGNDANVAALAEVARGAARGYRHAIYITVSTGIGSGIIYDGRLLLGKGGLAGEAGHMVMQVGDRVSSLENEASGTALAAQARERLRAGEFSAMLAMAGGNMDEVDARIIGLAAQEGDPLALELVERCGRIVGMGVVTLLHLFNPEIIVIGGGVSNIGALLFNAIEASVRDHALDESYWRDLKIRQAGLGGDVSIVGAAALVITGGGHADVSAALMKLG